MYPTNIPSCNDAKVVLDTKVAEVAQVNHEVTQLRGHLECMLAQGDYRSSRFLLHASRADGSVKCQAFTLLAR